MSSPTRSSARHMANPSYALLVVFLVILWIAGGASRPDVFGQVVTRGAAWLILLTMVFFAPVPRWRLATPVALFLALAVALVFVQLLPLPAAIWTAFPGRELLKEVAEVSGQAQPWRPISISPEATTNALSSLIVPVTMFLLLAGISRHQQMRVLAALLGLTIASALLGILQFSGAHFDNPLINDSMLSVSSSFANRNHFALFLAIGLLLAPAWGFRGDGRPGWREAAAIALLPVFALIILASGSRAGIVLGLVGTVLGLFNVRQNIFSKLRSLPKKVSLSLAGVSLGLFGLAIFLSVTLHRAASLDRIFALEAGEDLRRQALPTVLEMIVNYFPAGTGFGTFDPAYRIDEPSELLGTAYFNHAHNDLLEVILDGGLPGFLLLSSGIVWWLWRSARAWRSESNGKDILPRLGAGILLLILVASLADYPARTPMVMACVVIAAVWLCDISWPKTSAKLSREESDKLHRS